jgi:hypothetical protein
MKKLYFSLLAVLLSTGAFAQAFTGTYDFASVTTTSGLIDPTPVPTATGITFGSFSATNPVATNPGANGRFVFDNQPLGATHNNNVYADLTGSVDLGVYFEVTLTPQSGYSVDFTSITFTSQRSGTGIRTYVVRSSADSYATNLPASISPANTQLSVEAGNVFFRVNDNITNAQNGSTITLSGAPFTALESPITFRFYGYNAEAATGNFSIDNVAISGNINTLSTNSNQIEGLKMYPNPLKGNTLFLTSTVNANMSVQIFDVLGKEVLKSNVINNAVNVSGLNAGVYIVKITEEGKAATRKLVIQ